VTEPTRRGLPLLDAALLAVWAVLLLAWFGAWPAWLPPLVPFALLVLLAGLRVRARPPELAWPRRETIACLLLAALYRLPALLEPWGFVNKDGAYGAFVALHLQQGVRPAPVFTEGANYQGTLKGHLAAVVALLTGSQDLSWLVVAASVLLYLVFVAASMSLCRRLAGRPAAWAVGLYLAASPRFLTVFSVNSVGQYVDVLALGGLALALCARLFDEDRVGRDARAHYAGIGLLLGAAFWQQPVALAYALAVAAVLLVRRASWRDPFVLLVPLGFLLGALPVVTWNVQNDWASSFIMGRETAEVGAQIQDLPSLAVQTVRVAFPVLAGASPGHPWGRWPGVKAAALVFIPGLLLAFLALRGRAMLDSLRAGRPTPALLPPLLIAANLALFWSVAAGMVYRRPRYLLPLLAASAVQLGVVAAWMWARRWGRMALVPAFLAVLAFDAAGTAPRMADARLIANEYRRLVAALEQLDIRTAYSDFSISAPVTMFTRERILVSPRLGPTPAYESDSLAARVDRVGADAYILPPGDDPEAFAAELRRHGILFRRVGEPLAIFYDLHPKIRAEEVRGFRGDAAPVRGSGDE
jgi:hypothetical protein